ncbi:FHA domain-containing protein, partial [Acinetobacter baumannii]
MAGSIGGFVGGAIAGVLFDPVAFMLGPLKMLLSGTSEVGGPSRAATFLLIGFCVGLFTGLVDLLTRHAWVRLVLGRNEGREWPLDSQVTTFGRDERALVPVFGDTTVAPLHASVVRQGSNYVLHDAGTSLGVGLNG